jgi:dTDP-4-dehydrorhamnose reductase
MSRIIVLGATGMLGSKVFQIMRENFPDVSGTISDSRKNTPQVEWLFGKDKPIIFDLQHNRLEDSLTELCLLNPDLVINTIGLTPHNCDESYKSSYEHINGDWPNLLAEQSFKTIHISTDCIFSGHQGNYKETSMPTATDIYGKSKFWGEQCATKDNVLCLRTSLYGPELFYHGNLFNWFITKSLKQEEVKDTQM